MVAAAAAAGLPVDSARRSIAPTARRSTTRPRRSATSSLLHFTDCHAQLNPIYFREPSVNLGFGAARGHRRISSARRCSRISTSGPGRAKRTPSPISISRRRRGPTGLPAASRISPRWSSGSRRRARARCCSTAATPGRARRRRCGRGAGHGRRAEAARRRRDDRALGVHATAPSA